MLTTQKGQKIAPETLLLWLSHTPDCQRRKPTKIPSRCPLCQELHSPGQSFKPSRHFQKINHPQSINPNQWHDMVQRHAASNDNETSSHNLLLNSAWTPGIPLNLPVTAQLTYGLNCMALKDSSTSLHSFSSLLQPTWHNIISNKMMVLHSNLSVAKGESSERPVKATFTMTCCKYGSIQILSLLAASSNGTFEEVDH